MTDTGLTQNSVKLRILSAPWHLRAAFLVPMLSIACMVALHGLKADHSPYSRFLSEYALGSFGWLMALAFWTWAFATGCLAVSVWSRADTIGGKFGTVILFAVALSLLAAGLFPQDPVSTEPGQQTLAGQLHGLAAMIGIPGQAIAAFLIGRSLNKTSHAFPMLYSHLPWISLAAMVTYLAWAVPHYGGFGPDVAGGLMNRLVVAAYLLWQMRTAKYLIETKA